MYFFFLGFAARYRPGSMDEKICTCRAGRDKNYSGRAGQLFLAAHPNGPGRPADNYGSNTNNHRERDFVQIWSPDQASIFCFSYILLHSVYILFFKY